MSILRALNDSAEANARVRDFIQVVRLFAATRGDMLAAMVMADQNEVSPNVAGVLKAAVSPGTLANPSWAAPLSQYGVLISAFLGSLRNVGAFDRMLPDMRTVPLRTRVGAVTAGAAGSIVAEGAATPISSLALASGTLDEQKAVAILAITQELARGAGDPGIELIGRELRRAVGATTDAAFVSTLLAGVTPITSSGTTVTAARADIAAAIRAITTDAASRPYLLTTASVAKDLALMPDSAGAPAFPEMTPMGGTVSGVPVVVTDGAASGTMVAVDANQVAAGSGTVTLDATNDAALQMSTTPDNPATASTVLVSLWQSNMVGLKATRYFGAQLLRSDAVAVISAASYH